MIIFTKRQQIVILFMVVIVIFITFFNISRKDSEKESIFEDDVNKLSLLEDNQVSDNDINSNDVESQEVNGTIMVHISGQVYKPGLIELENGSRVIDAVNKAGGMKSEADIDRINLAKKVVDEEKIYIPKIGEEVSGIDVSTNLCEGSTSEDTGKVNINNCTKEDLMTLSGIGEVLATRIIEYRETNEFKSINDIMNVSGIGAKKFENIKNHITVN